MQYTSRIILDNKLNMLAPLVYRNRRDIETWETRELRYVEPLRFEPTGEGWTEMHLGDHWKTGFDRTRIFRARVALPEDLADGRRVLVLNMGGEGQVRINGEIVSSVTSYKNADYLAFRSRSRVYIPERYRPGDVLEIEVEACLNFLEFSYAITLKEQEQVEEYTLKTAFLAAVDEEIEAYYFDLLCAVEAMDVFQNPLDVFADSNARVHDRTVQRIMEVLNGDSGMHKKLFRAITDSVGKLDLEFDIGRLKASVPAAREALREGIEALPERTDALVKFVGQAHIDTAWLWPIKESVRKTANTFSNALDLMDRYPEFIFAFSQPQLFAYLEEFYPEVFERVRQRVLDGRIELVGNAWVEMDTNVPSGESLVRQLLYGRQYYLSRFGKCSRVFWMPDVFGYTWALPQIMKRSGVDYFFTSKLNNNDTNRFPHSLFLWQGTDGTRILSYLQRLNYNGLLNAATLSQIHALFDQKDVCDTALMTVGYGDGGGGTTYQMLENGRRLRNFPGLPKSEFATSESFFMDAEKAECELPVWNDEMYYEFHRGTYTSQANTKKNNRKGEFLLRRTEMACAMESAHFGTHYPAEEIGNLWKILLTNQFHDILPGSSIGQVYEDCDASYKKVFEGAEALFSKAVRRLNAELGVTDRQIAVWNFLGWEHAGEAAARLPGAFSSLRDAEGNIVPCTATPDGDETEFRFEARVPALGVSIYTASDEEAPKAGLCATVRCLENAHLRLMLDEDGNIESLFDKCAGREVFAGDDPSNLLTIFEDIPHRESAWNIDIEYQSRFWTLQKAESVTLAENSPVRAVVRTVRKFNLSTITQDIVLARDARRVDFVTHVSWQETQRMLKASFRPDVLSQKATYEIQFGAIERPTHWNTSYDRARFEVCCHKWADLSEGHYGVSLLNDCKYGCDIKDNRMRLTLLRAPNYPDPVGDKGEHSFVYSIYPHAGDWRTGGTVREAYSLNEPLRAFAGDASAKRSVAPFSFAEIDCKNVIIDTIKGAEDGDGIILRAYESEGARGTAKVSLCIPIASVAECNLMEEDERDVATDKGGFAFAFKPYEIKTFRIRR
ncbi:MAG: alpha-mannosidase [Christensenellales bacterium]|jgi:alpha-mannosidase